MMIKRTLNDIQLKLFTLFVIISYILVILSFLGLYDSAPNFLNSLDYYVRIYVCLFLIWRFKPLRIHVELNELDRKIAFTAGVFILTTTFLGDIMKYVTTVIKNKKI
jgi:hypothetical protein